MNGSVTKKRRPPPQPLSVFGKTSAGVLLVHITLLVGLGIFVQQSSVLIIAGIELLFVALIMMGIRWAPLLGSALGGLMLYVFLTATSYPLHHLSHPKDAFGFGVQPGISFLMFMVMTTLFWCGAMLVVTGVAAVIHNYFQHERRTPRWFKAALTGAICVWFGAFLLGSLVQPDPVIATSANNGAPTVHLFIGSFSQSSITLSKGAKLTLIDDGTYHHNISTGRWVNGQPTFENQTGAPVVRNRDIDAAGASLVIGPFNTAGTYYLMCSLHHNMVLKVIVQ